LGWLRTSPNSNSHWEMLTPRQGARKTQRELAPHSATLGEQKSLRTIPQPTVISLLASITRRARLLRTRSETSPDARTSTQRIHEGASHVSARCRRSRFVAT